MKPSLRIAATRILATGLSGGVVLAVLGTSDPARLWSQAAAPAALQRHYQDGEKVAYRMSAINQGHERTIRYQARADGVVKKDASGTFLEEFTWSNVQVNGGPFPLSLESQQFREPLSLAPGYTLSVPDLSKVQPILIGPITDLLTFYADAQLAMRQKDLVHAGDHVYVKHGVPNSWADGTYVVLGQDAIDFDISLKSMDQAGRVATLMVRHVPPSQLQIKFPVAWMLAPIGSAPNNWTEVEKNSSGKYSAEVGQETFEAEIKISLPAGRILSATMDNPVEVLERDCDDKDLAVCGAPVRYQIRRQITLDAVPES